MYNTENLLKKLNAFKTTRKVRGPMTMGDIMLLSLDEFRNIADEALPRGESNYLYSVAQAEAKENKVTEISILSRANPQLQHAVQLGIHSSSLERGYNDLFGERARRFARPGSVASMFSPAGYLTELYREARKLHSENSVYNLDKRRADLGNLVLSQKNMNKEVTTLSLSNEMLLSNIQKATNKNREDVIKMLSTYRHMGENPFHLPSETIRQAILTHDEQLEVLIKDQDVGEIFDLPSLLAIKYGISPELYQILTEKITEENLDQLIKKNFGSDQELAEFENPNYLASYYGITNDELSDLIAIMKSSYKKDSYKNDTLTIFTNDDDGFYIQEIKRTYGKEADYLKYAEIIPDEKGSWILNIDFTFLYTNNEAGWNNNTKLIKIGTTGKNSNDLGEITQLSGEFYSKSISLTEDQLSSGVTITISKKTNLDANSNYIEITFKITKKNFSEFLLRFNKIMRLYKAMSMKPIYLLHSMGATTVLEVDFSREILDRLFRVQLYMERYKLDEDKALVLSGRNISEIAQNSDEPSMFTRLFNTPLFNNKVFYPDADYSIDLSPESEHDEKGHFILSVIKHAFNVTDIELFELWKIVKGNNGWEHMSCSIANLSALYRACLMAEVHHLTIEEFILLVSLSPFKGSALLNQSDIQISTWINFFYRTTTFMAEKRWSLAEVFLMTTKEYSTTLTPEISQFIAMLREALLPPIESAFDEKVEKDEQYQVLLSLISAEIKLSSIEKTRLVLKWADGMLPGKLDTQGFFELVRKPTPSEQENKQMAQFCQGLAQLVLITNALMLGEAELSLLVEKTARLIRNASHLDHDIALLSKLAHFHDMLNECGEHAAEILAALKEKKLSTQQLATVLNLEPLAVKQALDQVKAKAKSKSGKKLRKASASNTSTTVEEDLFQDWEEVEKTFQWIDVAKKFHITPSKVAELSGLHYDAQTRKARASYSSWLSMAEAMEAGLNRRQLEAFQGKLDEKISAATSSWYIKNEAPDFVQDRDGLYNYLLMDNQVSSEIKTTVLAEAIASLQLYINRSLNGQDKNASYLVKGRQFFTDWDRYNKRYSTWAGVSQLVYYPENYIDPSIRVGQTTMMTDLLAELSQAQLSEDVAGNAMHQYMKSFDEVANLEILSGYHNNYAVEEGLTYLVARDRANSRYYWRSLDQSKFNNSNGKFPANAWSEWKAIQMGLNPVEDWIRLVFWQSKLWIVWVEKKEFAVTLPAEGNTSLEIPNPFELKLSQLRLDGSWSAPLSLKLQMSLLDKATGAPSQKKSVKASSDRTNKDTVEPTLSDLQLYVSHVPMTGALNVFLYEKIATTVGTGGVEAVFISDKFVETKATQNLADVSSELDRKNSKRVNFPTRPSSYAVDSRNFSLDYTWGDRYLTILHGGKFFNFRVDLEAGTNACVIKADADVSIAYTGVRGQNSGTQMDLIKHFQSKMGGSYLFYGTVEKFSGEKIWLVGDKDSKKLYLYKKGGFRPEHISISKPADGSGIQRVANKKSEEYIDAYWSWSEDLYTQIWLNQLGFEHKTIMSDPYIIDTGLELKDVKVSLSWPNSAGKIFLGNSSFVLNPPVLLLNRTTFPFRDLEVTVPNMEFGTNGIAELTVTFSAIAKDGRFLGSQSGTLRITRKITKNPGMVIKTVASGTQYLQRGPYRVRLNTLFSNQLAERASRGLASVWSMETQLLPEPRMGQGSYIRVTLPVYDAKLHGQSRNAKLYLWRSKSNEGEAGYYYVWSGQFADVSQSFILFVPLSAEKFDDIIDFPYAPEIGLNKRGVELYMTYDNGSKDSGRIGCLVVEEKDGSLQINKYWRDTKCFIQNIQVELLPNESYNEPMDFSGANALYFWEMFYYSSMLIFQRLLQEGNFADATEWLKYIWRPDGYIKNGQPTFYHWNCRPLEEDASWNSEPLDSVDADAVAQSDPMHYKVYVFMSFLDLLISQGDQAYRQLERDTLNEAKMLYVQALSLLGYEPYTLEGDWQGPTLSQAADTTQKAKYETGLFELRQAGGEVKRNAKTRTANSLTQLFLPQVNEKLQGYWQTLDQRLFNLRHNLSIDGQPLNLPIFAPPADPKALLAAAASASGGGSALPSGFLSLYRFQPMLDNARNMVSQLTQFGSTLLSLIERQDAEALAELLQGQAEELARHSIQIQEETLQEIKNEEEALKKMLTNSEERQKHYKNLYDQHISPLEHTAALTGLVSQAALGAAGGISAAAYIVSLAPNIFGMALGGSQFSGPLRASAVVAMTGASLLQSASQGMSIYSQYDRRREEWEIQYKNAEGEVDQIKKQIDANHVRYNAALKQKGVLVIQNENAQTQLSYLKDKFSNKALYSWLRGRLTAIYRQFYDLTLSRCLMAQSAYEWHFGLARGTANFIKPGIWQSNQAGLMSGESLAFALGRMEEKYFREDKRVLEVVRTVSLSDLYANMGPGEFNLAEKVIDFIAKGNGDVGDTENYLKITNSKALEASFGLASLKIKDDYPEFSGKLRRIKQISVSLPLLMGPYQDVQAVLNYGGSSLLPKGCTAVAISHGMNDSGQFQLDFNDARYLPFEGIAVDEGTFHLSFPNATTKQKELLQTLTDIILHIRYTVL